MELLETQHPEKRKLLETSQRHRQEMEREIKDISDRSEKVLKNALVIGGALALTCLVVSHLGASKNKKSKPKKTTENAIAETQEQQAEEQSPLSKMGDKAIQVASVFLLDLAKEKLSEYLQRKKSADENP